MNSKKINPSQSNQKRTKNPETKIKANDPQNNNSLSEKSGNKIIYLLKKIWTNIKVMQWLAMISTVITIILGINEMVSMTNNKLSSRTIKALMGKVSELPNIKYEELLNWRIELSKFKDDLKYQDEYNFMKGCEMDIGINTSLAENLSPDYYFKRISSTSKLYDEVIIHRFSSYHLIKDDSIRKEKQNQLIRDLEDLEYKSPPYYMFKARLACWTLNINTILKNYGDFITTHEFIKDYAIINPSSGTMIDIDGNRYVELMSIDLFYLVYIYTFAKDEINKEGARKKIEKIISSNGDDLRSMQMGYDLLLMYYPLFNSVEYEICVHSQSNYVFYQKDLLKKLLEGKFKVP